MGGSKKLYLYPTNLAYSTPVMGWKGLGEWLGVGFVECVGLFGALNPGGAVEEEQCFTDCQSARFSSSS
jgi:hypothetical protein